MGTIILALLFFAASIILFTKRPNHLPAIVPTTLMIISVLIFIFSTIIIVAPGTAATTEFLGKVNNDVLYQGIHLVNPMCTVRRFNVQIQAYTVERLTTPAADQMNVAIDFTVQYRIVGAALPEMRNNVGTNEEQINAVLLTPGVRGSFRDAAANFSSADLYIEKREEFQSIVTKNLQKNLGERIEILNIIIRNVTPPPKIVSAIESKQEAEQEAQKMRFVLEKTELEAQQRVIEARGIRDSQDIIAQKLTPAYLTWYRTTMLKELVNSPNNTVIIMPENMGSSPIMLNMK